MLSKIWSPKQAIASGDELLTVVPNQNSLRVVCGAEMYTMQRLNQGMDLTIYGIVSNGETWEIAKLDSDLFTFFKNRYDINDLKKLYNALSSVMVLCLKQFWVSSKQ